MFDHIVLFMVALVYALALAIFLATGPALKDGQPTESAISETVVSFSTLPQWDQEWESRDPLRGKQGWEVRDYINIAVAIFWIVMSIGLLVPAISVAREAQSRTIVLNRMRDVQFSQQLQFP